MKNPEIGTLVTLSDAPDACVYLVSRQHHSYKKLYLLTYQTAIGEVDAGWNDCSLFQIPTQQQFNNIDNRFTAQHN